MDNINITDTNTWDDSELLQTWNKALHEYNACNSKKSTSFMSNTKQRYHSIQARGEKVEDVLNEYELEQLRECVWKMNIILFV